MYSATLTDEVETIIHDFFNAPEKVEAAPAGTPLENIAQTAYHVPNFHTKINLLGLLLRTDTEMKKVLVFAGTKKMADDIYARMWELFPEAVGVIHAGKTQPHRFDAVQQFDRGSYRVLIATDLIARGLDISEVSHVVNFDVPAEPESYIHRIGRTGRADQQGQSITFITPRDEAATAAIEQLMSRTIPVQPAPDTLEISTELIPDEIPRIEIKGVESRLKAPEHGIGFHQKSAKNMKENFHLTRAKKMQLKYGKPKKRRGKK